MLDLGRMIAAMWRNVQALSDVSQALASNVAAVKENTAALQHDREVLREILVVLKDIKFRVCPPGLLSISFKGETGVNMDKILFDVSLPLLAKPNDVKSRELKVVIDGVITDSKSAGPDDTVISGCSAPQDSAVTLELRDIDDSGNVSAPSVYEFVAVDTVAPAAPGELGVLVVGESSSPDPVDPPSE